MNRRFNPTGAKASQAFRRAGRVAAQVALLLVFCSAPVMADGKDLRAFYMQNCAVCHGPDGSAVDAEGKRLKGRDFTNPEWQRDAQDDQMVKVILKGKFFGLAMPAFKDALTPDEARQMVTEIIRTSKKGQPIAAEAKGPGVK
ncbi:MAG: cytochrome c [Desulfobacterales bacterium]|nr:cytochrome c [Desulfobacterales bacterium]